VTKESPDEHGVPVPPDDTSVAYARRVWQDVSLMLIACCVVGVSIVGLLLIVGYRIAGIPGVTTGALMAVVGLVLLARKLLTY
jgi:hypothetical protein